MLEPQALIIYFFTEKKFLCAKVEHAMLAFDHLDYDGKVIRMSRDYL
jgi:hypothetical protein